MPGMWRDWPQSTYVQQVARACAVSDRRAFFCPECKSDVIGALVNVTSIRCDYRIDGWKSVEVGRDKKRQPVFEHTPNSRPGCGGILHNCFHGLKTCGICPPVFTKATTPIDALPSLGDIFKEEARLRAEREQVAAYARNHSDAPAFVTPKGKVQLPHLGDAEPTRYVPPRSRRKKPA